MLATPVLLFWVGLSGIDGMPSKPSSIAPREQQLWVWQQARGKGEPKVEATSPYSVAAKLLIGRAEPTPAGELATWWVASDYLLAHQRYRGMGWWHLSGTALTIWLTRNWTTEEVLSAAALALEARGRPAPFNDQKAVAESD
jgi:hypothetical protein